MKWKEFKDAIEACGVSDDTFLGEIEMTGNESNEATEVRVKFLTETTYEEGKLVSTKSWAELSL
jgi:hypothetical protein